MVFTYINVCKYVALAALPYIAPSANGQQYQPQIKLQCFLARRRTPSSKFKSFAKCDTFYSVYHLSLFPAAKHAVRDFQEQWLTEDMTSSLPCSSKTIRSLGDRPPRKLNLLLASGVLLPALGLYLLVFGFGFFLTSR